MGFDKRCDVLTKVLLGFRLECGVLLLYGGLG